MLYLASLLLQQVKNQNTHKFTGFHVKTARKSTSERRETGRSFGVQKEVELHEGKKYTRSTRKQSQLQQNKSAITDHVNTENHIIDWEEATIIGRESDRTTRWIREAIKI